MLLESLESRNLLAGDDAQFEDAAHATVTTEGSALGAVAASGLKGAGLGVLGGYGFHSAVGLVCGSVAGAAAGAAAGAGVGAIAFGAATVVNAVSDMMDDSDQDRWMPEASGAGQAFRDLAGLGSVGGAFIGGIAGAVAMGNKVSWDIRVSETQGRVLTGAVLGAAWGLMHGGTNV